MSPENLPPTWERVKLGEVSSIVMGQSPPSTTYNEEGDGLFFLQGKAEFTEIFPLANKFCNKPLKVAKGGSVLISVRAPVGDVNLADRDYIIGRGLASIKLKKGDKWFLFYLLLHNKKNIESQGTGTTFQSINRTVLDNFPIPLPSLLEQRVIARALRAVQEAREARRREAALERERKAALMDYLFTHGTRGEPRQQTDVGEIPQSWQAVRLGEISKVRYGLGQPPQLDDNGIPMIRATDIKKGQIISDRVLKVKKEAIPKSRSPFLKKGDILVVRSGAYTGDVAMYDGRWEEAIAGYDLVAAPNEEVNAVFLAQYLLGDRAQRFFKSQRDRSAQPHLNSEQLGNTLVPLPSNSEQGDIAAALITCDVKIAALEQEAALLEELFRAMLEELMTGRLSALPLVEAEGTA